MGCGLDLRALRQDLRVFMDSVSVIDQPLVLDAVRTLVLGTFTAYQEGSQIKWNDAELAVYLVYVFGEVNKCKSCSLQSSAGH